MNDPSESDPVGSWEVVAEALMQVALDGALREMASGNKEGLFFAYFDVFEAGKSAAEMEGLTFNTYIENIGDPYNLLKAD